MNTDNRPVAWLVWGGLIAVILLILIIYGAGKIREKRSAGIPPLRILSRVTGFSLTNHLGQPADLADLKGQLWVADIIFTRCPGPCVHMTRRMRQLQEALPAGLPVKLISLTTDPEYDTPEVLRAYAERFGAREERWWFLTGPKADIHRLAVHDLKLVLEEKTPARREVPTDLFIHSTLFVVVDAKNRLRALFEVLPRLESEEEAVLHRLAESRSEADFHDTLQAIIHTLQILSRENRLLTFQDLPAVNACLNGISALFLLAGFVFIRRGNQSAHQLCMLSALLTSALFLVCYLVYHAWAGHTAFKEPAWFRPYYLGLLASHVVLAALIVPLALMTAWRAIRQRFDAHKKLARWTWPLWMYVSVTGVLIYFIIHRIFPQS